MTAPIANREVEESAPTRSGGSVRIPLVLAVSLLLVVVAVVLWNSLTANDGHLVYALDDPYIHMALAHNLAEHGVYGVTHREFASASSSPAWVLLLAAGFRVLGAVDWLPLALNTAAAVLVLVAAYALCRAQEVSRGGTLTILLAVLLLTPLVPLVFMGMEHVLHVALVLLLALAASRALRAKCGRRDEVLLVAIGGVAAAVRPESVFVLVPLGVALMLLRRPRLAMLLGVSAAAPWVAYGLVSVANGSMFLPNPIVLKGSFPKADDTLTLLNGLGGRAVRVLARPSTAHLWGLTLASAAIYAASLRRLGPRAPRQILAATTVTAILLHCQFAAQYERYPRYEAYLVALGCVTCGILLDRDVVPAVRTLARPGTRLPLALATLMVAGLLVARPVRRGVKALLQTARATTNIYRQQFQMARFLHEHYPGASIAANDIGAIHYYADPVCLDLAGLATVEVAREAFRDAFDTASIRRHAEQRRVRIAIAYRDWLPAPAVLPQEWIEVGTWTIPDNVVCGDATVYFLATSAGEAISLESALRAFAPRLPSEVAQTGRYVDGR